MQTATLARGRRIRMRLSILAALTLLMGLLSALALQMPAHASTVATGDFVYTARTSSDTLVKLHTSSGAITLADVGGNPTSGSGGYGMAAPAISPDGSKVAFTMYNCNLPGSANSCTSTIGESQVLVVINSDGSGLQAITSGTSTQNVVDWEPTWNNDGTWIAFERVTGSSKGIFKIHPDGTGLTQLINDTGYVSNDYQGLVWSPDGTKFAYAHLNTTTWHMELRYSNTDGSSETVISNQPNPSMDDNSMPAWAPNSSRLYFQNLHFGTATIQGINLNGTSLQQETNGGSVQEPSVSADGSTLIVSAGSGYSDLFTVPTDGSKTQTTVTSDSSSYIHEWPSFVKADWTMKQFTVLGDSFSSGEGNPPFESGTDTSTDKCHRSDVAYAKVLASHPYGLTLHAFVACSGATSGDMLSTYNSEDSQLNHLGGSDYIILTIGGDDIQFQQFATDCVESNCDGSTQYNTTEGLIQNTLPGNLDTLFGDIATALGSSDARVLVVGYPYILPDSGSYCSFLSSAEQTAATNVQTDLEGAIHAAVTRAASNHEPFEFVDPNGSGSPFAGHELCSSQPYFNSLDLVNQEYSFHPNSDG